MIIVAGTARVLTDRRDDAIRRGIVMAATSEEEDGCISYRVTGDLLDPVRFHIMEVWRDEAALQAHFRTEHFQTFAKFLSEALDGPGDFRKYEVSADGPLFG
jgi:quinol monooxygenase YgiN